MLKTIYNYFRQLSITKILQMLFIVIALHLIVMFLFMENGRAVRQTMQRDELIQKIINAIYLVEATPVANRKHAVEVMADPELKASFTLAPKWPEKFENISFWEISQALRKDSNSFQLSIKLGAQQWLNLHASMYPKFMTKQLIWFAAEIFIFLTIFLSIWSINRYQRPLAEFKKALQRIGADINSVNFRVDGPVAIRETAKAFNDMQKRIQELIRDRTQMLAAISHDLRTPITRLKIRSQFIEDENEQQNLIKDLDEMETMISEILAFARDDANKENKIDMEIISLLYSICNDFRDMGHTIEFKSSTQRQSFLGRPLGLKRAFTNLISNAVRYGKNVQVKVQKSVNKLQITIDDAGPGIPEAELEQVFAPFYRGEHSRSRDTGGVGLGLAVTREIIRAHNGKITLKNRRPHGLRVSIEFTI